MAWELLDIFTPEGVARLEREQRKMITFAPNGKRVDYRIMRIKNGKVWGKKIVTVNPRQVIVTDKKTGKKDNLEDLYEV